MGTRKVKRIPSTANGITTTYTARSGTVYKITKNTGKPWFYLWKVTHDGWFEKLAEMESPYGLYVLIDEIEGIPIREGE